jgi:hypothetical protein
VIYLAVADGRVRNMGAAYSRRRALPTFNKPRARDTHS